MTFVAAGTEDVDDEEDADPDVVTFKGGEIDLSGELRDELVLAMPFNPALRRRVPRPLSVVRQQPQPRAVHARRAATPTAPGGLAALGKIKL